MCPNPERWGKYKKFCTESDDADDDSIRTIQRLVNKTTNTTIKWPILTEKLTNS